MALITTLVLIGGAASNLSVKSADFDLFSTLGGDKTEVTPGESLQYTITVRNDGTQNLNNVRVNQNFIPQITYVNGSTTAEKNGTTINVLDNWTGDGGFNFGSLTPGQIGYLKFSGLVAANVTVGTTLQNRVSIRTDEVDWVGRAFSITIVSPNQDAILRGGDFMKVTNNTLQNGWQDSVSVGPSDVVEFLVKISNDGQFDARNVKLAANLPSSPATIQHPTVTLTSDNSNTVTDSTTVTGSSPFWFVYKIGHATLFGNTQLYNCPTGCRIPESFYLSPLNLGTVKPGESASIQVTYKADIFTPTTTPTPTATATPTPTATPTATPTSTPTSGPTSRCVDLVASTTDGTIPLTVTFAGQGEDTGGNIQEYEFNFGDSSGGQSQTVKTTGNQASHTYHNAGTFIASLLVKDSRGSWQGGDQCKVNLTTKSKPTVLAAQAPKKLPKAGADALQILLIPGLGGAGIYLYRRFKLL